MEITIRIKDVYGTRTIYPVCQKAHFFAAIAGTKTITRGTLQLVKALGYTVQYEEAVL